MSNAEKTPPKHRVIGVPFKPGQSGNPAGRPKGARSRLGELFIENLRDSWERDGADALARCARDDPGQYLRVIASLMPKDLNVNIGLNASSFAATFAAAVQALGNDPSRKAKVINGR